MPPSHVLDSHLYSAAAGRCTDAESQEKDSGQARLEALGHRQALSRRLGLLSSAGSSFAVTSYMMSLTGEDISNHDVLSTLLCSNITKIHAAPGTF